MNTSTNNVKVEVIKMAAFYNEGLRGVFGGAPQNDKIWGIAKVNGTLVTFNGRRGGKLRFKTFTTTQMPKAMAKYAEKIGGRTDGGDIYTPINNPGMRDLLVPNMTANMVSDFYSAMARGVLNTRH